MESKNNLKTCDNCGHTHENKDVPNDMACDWCEDNKEWIKKFTKDQFCMHEVIKQAKEIDELKIAAKEVVDYCPQHINPELDKAINKLKKII